MVTEAAAEQARPEQAERVRSSVGLMPVAERRRLAALLRTPLPEAWWLPVVSRARPMTPVAPNWPVRETSSRPPSQRGRLPQARCRRRESKDDFSRAHYRLVQAECHEGVSRVPARSNGWIPSTQPPDAKQQRQERHRHANFAVLPERDLDAVPSCAFEHDQVGNRADEREVAGECARHGERQP